MNKVCGIVAEYNPFHKGHMYHIQKAKELSGCDVLIAVMSGNFVQRGEPAIIDKWQRAKIAVENGVDIVIELPYIYSTQAATKFAQGSIALLKLAKVDSICFGSESNNLEELQEIADTSINPNNLKESLATGNSFVHSYGLLSKEMGPNDILGVCYLKALKNTTIKPYTIQRTVQYHDEDINQEYASASAIRKALVEGKSLHNQTPMKHNLDEYQIVELKQYYTYLRMLLLTLDHLYLSELFLFSEGIENHLVSCAKECESYDSFINAATTKRYTASRIKRCLLQLLCQIKKSEVEALTPLDTLRVLAFNTKGQEYLAKLKKEDIKIASRFSKVPLLYRQMEYKTTLLYTMFMNPEQRQRVIESEIGGPIVIK